MQILDIWIISDIFWAISDTKSQIWGSCSWPIFSSSNYRHVGCPEQCHVTLGLSATFSNARSPLRGSKRPKSQFYGHFWPKIPILGTSFSAIFFSSKYRHVGCPERCHVMSGPYATFSNPRNPLRGS